MEYIIDTTELLDPFHAKENHKFSMFSGGRKKKNMLKLQSQQQKTTLLRVVTCNAVSIWELKRTEKSISWDSNSKPQKSNYITTWLCNIYTVKFGAYQLKPEIISVTKILLTINSGKWIVLYVVSKNMF